MNGNEEIVGGDCVKTVASQAKLLGNLPIQVSTHTDQRITYTRNLLHLFGNYHECNRVVVCITPNFYFDQT